MNVIQLALGIAGAGVLFAGKIGLDQLPAILVLGAAGLFAHYCMTNAFRIGDASLVVPLDFMRIPLIAVVGWWLYAEPLDIFVFAGAGLIITGILWNLRSEARRPSYRCIAVGNHWFGQIVAGKVPRHGQDPFTLWSPFRRFIIAPAGTIWVGCGSAP